METALFAGTEKGLYHLPDPSCVLGKDASVRHVVKQGERHFAIAGEQNIYMRSENGWSRFTSVDGTNLTCLAPVNNTLYAGTKEAHLYAINDGTEKPVRAFEEASDRENWYTPWGGPPEVRSLSAQESDQLYVNVHVGGILRYDIPTDQCEQIIDIDTDVHQVVFDRASDRLFAGTARGLAVSKNEGENWNIHTVAQPGSYMRAVAVTKEYVFVTASEGPHPDRAAVLRAPVEKPGMFEKIHDGLPRWFPDNVDTHCLDADGVRVVFATKEGTIYLSENGGSDWRNVTDDLPRIHCLSISTVNP